MQVFIIFFFYFKVVLEEFNTIYIISFNYLNEIYLLILMLKKKLEKNNI